MRKENEESKKKTKTPGPQHALSKEFVFYIPRTDFLFVTNMYEAAEVAQVEANVFGKATVLKIGAL